jgi:hypothetical protein
MVFGVVSVGIRFMTSSVKIGGRVKKLKGGHSASGEIVSLISFRKERKKCSEIERKCSSYQSLSRTRCYHCELRRLVPLVTQRQQTCFK